VNEEEEILNPDPLELRQLQLFDSLSDEELEQLSAWFEVRSVEAGRRLAMEGASGYSFFVILEGTAAVTRDGQMIRILEPGDFFGEVAILDSGRRTADVVATSPMKLVAMFGAEFRQLQTQFPEVAQRIEASATARSDRSTGQ
jgi:CRP-like cAMP-binding protein